MNYQEKYKAWLSSPLLDEAMEKELKSIKDNESEKKLCFGADLKFGTAGLRATLGVGSNKMNNVTVGWITQGLSNMLISRRWAGKGVVIGRDSRLKSKEFALLTACIFAANGIKVYLFDSICPTPQISYAVRTLNAALGINITASHNPKEYNGYKVYFCDGAQISPEIADEVINFAGTDMLCSRNICSFDVAKEKGMIEIIGEDMDISFLKEVDKSIGAPEEYNKELKVVYTPLYGSGYKLVPALLKKRGFKVECVASQMVPDGNFPTCDPPNPERIGSYNLALEEAKVQKADIILATDPDVDRVGALVYHNGEYVFLSGNQIGAVICAYRLENLKLQGKTPLVCKSLVSTDLVRPICEKYGAKLVNVPTGFKYIGEQIGKYENDTNVQFVLGFEESYGYLGAGYARDKDAVFAAGCVAQIAAFCKHNNKTCIDMLKELYSLYGYYFEKTQGLELDPLNGMVSLNNRLSELRSLPPKEINGQKITSITDYLKGIDNLPKLDILEFCLENGSKIIIRPSGTEPKVKIYALCKGKTEEEAMALCEDLSQSAAALLNL